MRAIPPELRTRPFSVAEAADHGISRRVLAGSRFTPVFRGVHRTTDLVMDLKHWLLAVLIAAPGDAVLSHRTALRWYGLDLRGGGDDRFHVSTRQNAVTREPRICVHRRRHPIGFRMLRGLPTTKPERTFVDCALGMTLVQVVAVAEWMIHRRLTTLASLREYAAGRHLDGVVAAREAIRYVRDGIRSPMETWVRMLVVLSGLPEPLTNHDVFDERGIFLACPDLAWPSFKVAVEYDGAWHEGRRQRVRDRDRREYLERDGWIVIVIVDRDLRVPADVVRRIHRPLAARGYTGPKPWLRFDDVGQFLPANF